MTIQLYELAGRDDRRFSPYCWRARMALEHKGLEYETVPVRFTDKDAIAFSGQERVPVIRDGNNVISDSWAIAEYLESEYPTEAPLFSGEVGRGLTRFLNVWADRTFHAALIKLVIADILEHVDDADRDYFIESRSAFFGKPPADLQTRSKADLQSFTYALSTIKASLGTNDFFGGNVPTYGDYILFGAFAWARAISEFPLVAPENPVYNWRERMLDLFDGMPRTAIGYDY